MTALSVIMSKGRDATITRLTTTIGTSGGSKQSYATILSGVKVFRQPASGSETERYGRENTRHVHVFFAPYEYAGQIITQDRIVLDGLTYDIQSALPVSATGCEHLEHLELTAEETKP